MVANTVHARQILSIREEFICAVAIMLRVKYFALQTFMGFLDGFFFFRGSERVGPTE
jgi:hypothetical protein